MNIKSIAIALSLGVMSAGLASCTGDPENTYSYSINVSNLIIPDDTSKPVTADVNCTYNLQIDGVKNKLTVNTSTLALDGKTNLSFTSDAMDCLSVAAGGEISGTFSKGSARLSNGASIEKINGFYTSVVYFYELLNEPFMPVIANPMLVMNYRTADATVRTFSMDSFFRGRTVTDYSFGGSDKNFSTEDAVYRVKFSSDMSTANVVIYNIRFALEMPNPLGGIVLKDLPVALTHQGYTIDASDIIPEMVGSGVLTPYPNFTFTRFLLTTTSTDLTEVSCEYVVKDTYKGRFSGTCCERFRTAN